MDKRVKPYRPDNWEKCPCDDCPEKRDDLYGRYCDISCGKWTAWKNHEAGADAMLEALKKDSFTRKLVLPADDKTANDLSDFKITKSGCLVFIPDFEE